MDKARAGVGKEGGWRSHLQWDSSLIGRGVRMQMCVEEGQREEGFGGQGGVHCD